MQKRKISKRNCVITLKVKATIQHNYKQTVENVDQCS